jgi:hypothetical protein
MGLLTWDIPSSHTKEAESIYLPIILSIVSANDNFCPRDVNDRMLEFTLILSQGGCHNGFIHRHFFLFSYKIFLHKVVKYKNQNKKNQRKKVLSYMKKY